MSTRKKAKVLKEGTDGTLIDVHVSDDPEKRAAQLANLRPFPKGGGDSSEIRRGKPMAWQTFRARCREFMEEDGWPILVNIASRKGPHQWAALDMMANYAYGKPAQTLELEGEPRAPIRFIEVALVGRAPEAEGPDYQEEKKVGALVDDNG